VDLGAVHDHLADVLGEVVADDAGDGVALLVDHGGGFGALGPLADRVPEAQQVVHVALDVGLAAARPGRAGDHADVLRDVQGAQDLAQAVAFALVGDAARDAPSGQAGHEHQVATGQAQVGGEAGPLIADAFLGDLDEYLLAVSQELADVAAPFPLADGRGQDVGDVKEPVLLVAELDEGGLDVRHDVDDDALLDVADDVLAARAFQVELLELAVRQDGDAHLLLFHDVDQHHLFHGCVPRVLQRRGGRLTFVRSMALLQ